MDKTKFQSIIRNCIRECQTPEKNTITKSDLKEVVRQIVKSILNEMGGDDFEQANRREADSMSPEIDVSPKKSTCQQCKGKGGHWMNLKDRSGKNRDGMGNDQIVPCNFPGCKNGTVDHDENYRITTGNLKEDTTTSASPPINLPGSQIPSTGKSGWVSKKGGSHRGVEGSPSGMTLTALGQKDMKLKQDNVYE